MTPDPKFYRWCTKIVTLAWRFRRPHYNCTYTFLILCLKESVVNTLLCKQTWGHLQSSLSWLGTCLVTSRVYLSWVHAYFEYLDPSTSKTCFSFIDQLNSALHSYTVKPQRLSSKWCPSKKATGSACSRTCAPRGKYGENECFLWMQIRSDLGILRLYHDYTILYLPWNQRRPILQWLEWKNHRDIMSEIVCCILRWGVLLFWHDSRDCCEIIQWFTDDSQKANESSPLSQNGIII